MPNPNILFSSNSSPPPTTTQDDDDHPPPFSNSRQNSSNPNNNINNNSSKGEDEDDDLLFPSSPNSHTKNKTTTMTSSSSSDTDDDDLQAPLLSSSTTLPEKLSVDDMLQKYCGEFGRWQMRHFVLTSLAWALEGFHTMVMIFADQQPTWRCVGSCPFATGGAAAVCGMEPGSWEWIGGGSTSTVATWDLVCGDRYKVGLVQALFFTGCMIGAGVFGYLSDTSLGRRGSLTSVCILNSIFGSLTALSPTYPIYTTLRFLTGFSTGGVGLCAFVLATEPVGPSKRGVAGMSTFYFFGTGIALLSFIASLTPYSWRTLYIASSIPSILFVLLVIPFLSESPRWYIIRGKLRDAMRVMNRIASVNGKPTIPSNVTLALDGVQRSSAVGSGVFGSFSITTTNKHECDDDDGEVSSGSLWDVMKSDVTRKRLILAVFINFLCSVTYYGLSLNVVNLETNLYLNVLLNAIAEMPAFFFTAMMLDRFGRRPLTIATMWFSGVFCLLGGVMGHLLISNSSRVMWKVLRMVCGVLGIFGVAGTYNLLFIYTTELFPTVVRNAALGCATQAAQMGAILSPFIVVLGSQVPFAVFAGCGIVGGLLAFLLPETLNRPLYDTMAGMEEGENK